MSDLSSFIAERRKLTAIGYMRSHGEIRHVYAGTYPRGRDHALCGATGHREDMDESLPLCRGCTRRKRYREMVAPGEDPK